MPRHLQQFRSLLAESLRFALSGLVSFPLGVGVSAFSHEVLGWSGQLAGAAAISVLLVFNFTVARTYTFRSSGAIREQLPRFLLVSISMRGVEYLLFLTFLTFGGIHYLYSLFAALTISFAVKFFLYRSCVFVTKPRPKTLVEGIE